jgi:hypothetical protein
MSSGTLLSAAKLKLDLFFDGIRFTESLGRAAEHSFPNFFPYRFGPGEDDPGGTGKASIPYMLITKDDTHIRVRGNRSSPWWVSGSRETGYRLRRDEGDADYAIDFESSWQWISARTSDDLPSAKAGISLHGDMAVINVAPGCEYFLAPRQDGVAMRCCFCTYGAPDSRIGEHGQVLGKTDLPESTYVRMQEVLKQALDETPIRHIYLVGGSLTDPREEGLRYAELARRVQKVNDHRVPVVCGSGALPEESLRVLHEERLVDAVSFNLEVWSKRLFSQVCPGKDTFFGYDAWIRSLERALELWGDGRVYSAMVAGVELGPELGLSPDEALEIGLRGAEDLCRRGILPIYSLYWPPSGRDYPKHLKDLRSYFERLQVGYWEIRQKTGVRIADDLVCHRCAYMQLECDIDRALSPVEATDD